MIKQTDALRWLSCDAAHAIAVHGTVLVTIWSGEMRAATVREAAAEGRRLAQLRPGETSFLNMIARGTPVPGNDVRAEFQQMMREKPGQMRCTAIVAEGGGFHGSVVRGVVTGLMMVVRPPFPMKVHAGVPEAAEWIAGQSAGSVAAGALVAAVEAMRARQAAPG